MLCCNKFISFLLALTFVFPFPLFAQQPSEQFPATVIPVYFFLHYTSDTALGILAVTPFTEEILLWVYAPIAISTDYIDGSAGTTRTFDGLIDDARIWNTALATSSLDANWKTALQGNETNLVAYYKLDNAYTDSTANSYNLTAASNPAFSATVPFNTGSGGGALTTYYYNYGTTTVSKQFIGQYYDSDTELSYLNARYYDPNRGQFLSQDPVFWGEPMKQALTDPQQLNSYSYASNNPITRSDPTGKFWYKGWYDWTGYEGWQGAAMKAGEALGGIYGGGVPSANIVISQNQDLIRSTSKQYNFDPRFAQAVIYEETGHMKPYEPFAEANFIGTPLDKYSGDTIGAGQVTAGYFGYTKQDLRDPKNNIPAMVKSLDRARGELQGLGLSTSPAMIASRYNNGQAVAVTNYGQRVAAQVRDINYHLNIITAGLQKLVEGLKSLVNNN